MGEFGATGDSVREGGGEGVRTDRCIAGLVGEMNEDRKAIVRKVQQPIAYSTFYTVYTVCV